LRDPARTVSRGQDRSATDGAFSHSLHRFQPLRLRSIWVLRLVCQFPIVERIATARGAKRCQAPLVRREVYPLPSESPHPGNTPFTGFCMRLTYHLVTIRITGRVETTSLAKVTKIRGTNCTNLTYTV
jgi:hypothetical protein